MKKQLLILIFMMVAMISVVYADYTIDPIYNSDLGITCVDGNFDNYPEAYDNNESTFGSSSGTDFLLCEYPLALLSPDNLSSAENISIRILYEHTQNSSNLTSEGVLDIGCGAEFIIEGSPIEYATFNSNVSGNISKAWVEYDITSLCLDNLTASPEDYVFFIIDASQTDGSVYSDIKVYEWEMYVTEASSPDAFISTWRTTSVNQSIKLPIMDGGNYNFSVDWGDGTNDTITSGTQAERYHTYLTPAYYNITIDGKIEGWSFYNNGATSRTNIYDVLQWGVLELGNQSLDNEAYRYFYNCPNLYISATDAPNLSNVENFDYMFANSDSLSDSNLSHWNTSTITDMSNMFYDVFFATGANEFNGDISGWDVSSVIDMSNMFYGSPFNGDLSAWDTSSVQNMYRMFYRSGFNQNINSWDVSSVTNMEEMFYWNVVYNQPLNNWNTSSLTNMKQMFMRAQVFNQDLDQWDVSGVSDMSNLFFRTPAFNGNISTWDVSGVTTMASMFSDDGYGNSFNQDLDQWNTSSVTIMSNMFASVGSFNGNISTWDTSSVTDMSSMFYLASNFNQDLSNWNTSSVTSYYRMFRGANNFDQNISNFDIVGVTNVDEMFYTGGGLSLENYDSLLSSWASSTPTSSLTFNAGDSIYKDYQSRDILTDTYSWTISDGGAFNNCYDSENLSTECPCTLDFNQSEAGRCHINGVFTLDGGVYNITEDITIYMNDGSTFAGNYSTIYRGDFNTYFMYMNGNNIDIGNFTFSESDDTGSVLGNKNIIMSENGRSNLLFENIDYTATRTSFTPFAMHNAGLATSNVIMNNVTITTGSQAYGIFCSYSNCDNYELNNVHIINSVAGLYFVTNIYNQDITNITIRDSSFTSSDIWSSYGALNFHGISGLTIDNVTTNTNEYGLVLKDARNVDVENSIFNSSNGIYFADFSLNDEFDNVNLNNNYINGIVNDATGSLFDTFIIINNYFDGSYSNWRYVVDLLLQNNTFNDHYLVLGNNAQFIVDDAQDDAELHFLTTTNEITLNDTRVSTSVKYFGTLNDTQSVNISDDIVFADNYVWVDETSFLNQEAQISFDELPTDGSDYFVFKDGLLQPEGTTYDLVFNDTNTLTINVSSFSNWSISLNSEPSINNFIPPDTNVSAYLGEELYFYINASDINNDTLYYSWYQDSVVVDGEVNEYYTWDTFYTDYGLTNITGKVNDSVLSVQNEWNVSLYYYPVNLYSYVDNLDVTATTIPVDWSTNADSIQIYLNDVLQTETSLITYTIEGLSPSTSYTIKVVPIKDGFYGEPDTIVQSTKAFDGNAPVMISSLISPATAYTETTLTGSCRASDIDTANIYYDYTWYVNGTSVKSGTTGVLTQGVVKSIGTLDSSNFVKNQNVTLGCVAHDGILSSSELNTTITIQNSQAEISSIFLIQLNATDYLCNHTYIDADNDPEITPQYEWYQNGLPTGTNTMSKAISDYNTSDQVFCQVTTGDGIADNVSANSSTYVVGDIGIPSLEVTEISLTAYTDTAMYIEATCTDDVGVASGFPVIRFTNPNLEDKYFSFLNLDGDTYYRYLTFPIAGTYTNVNVECCDGNSNCVNESRLDIQASVRVTEVYVAGGGGAGGTTEEPFRDITSFEVIPESISYSLAQGARTIGQIQVKNTDIVDIRMSVYIIRDNETPEVYDWMEFDDGRKSDTFTLQPAGGLVTSDRYLTYYINVPEDAELGQYRGVIEVSGLDQTGQMLIDINVRERNNLFAFLDTELFTLPTSENQITGDVIGGELSPDGRPVTLGALLLTISLIIGGFFGIRWGIRKARK